MNIETLGQWFWDAACAICGPVNAFKFKDYILPLVFLKWLSDVFEDELNEIGEVAAKYVEEDYKLVRLYLPKEAHWFHLRSLNANLSRVLRDAVQAVARHNSKLQGVTNTVGFNNHLYTFLSCYWQDGDFISKKEHYAMPYNSEEMYLYWANHDCRCDFSLMSTNLIK